LGCQTPAGLAAACAASASAKDAEKQAFSRLVGFQSILMGGVDCKNFKMWPTKDLAFEEYSGRVLALIGSLKSHKSWSHLCTAQL
jgi:hypothetical protein